MKNLLTQEEQSMLLETLKERFQKFPERHPQISWDEVVHKLLESPQKLWSLFQMEKSGGEPDLVIIDPNKKQYAFVDCTEESPKGRRSLCFDQKALDDRKENKPIGSAVEEAKKMGTELLSEQQYRQLQMLGEFDLKLPAGYKLQRVFVSLVAPYLVTDVTTKFSPIIMARSPIMRHGAFVPYFFFK